MYLQVPLQSAHIIPVIIGIVETGIALHPLLYAMAIMTVMTTVMNIPAPTQVCSLQCTDMLYKI